MTEPRRTFGRAIRESMGFYIGLIVLAIVVWQLTHYINSRPYFVAAAGDQSALSKALDSYAGVGNLLTTLATGLLAAMGWLLTSRPKKSSPERGLWPATAGAVCACLSIYFGYISSQNAQWAIENSIPTLDIDKMQWPRQLQFLALLLGVFFFADFVRRDWTKVD